MIETKSDKNDLRKFGGIMACFWGLVTGCLLWRQSVLGVYSFIISLAFLFSGLFAPRLLRPIYRIWTRLTKIINWLVLRFIIGLSFYLILTPTGLVARLCGHSFLDLKFHDAKDSYWILREKGRFKKSDYKRQF